MSSRHINIHINHCFDFMESHRQIFPPFYLFFSFLMPSRNNNDLNLFWSTSSPINQLFSTSLRSSTIKSLEIDDNSDGLIDRLEINLLIPLLRGERITSFDALIFSEIRLQQKVKYIFDAMTHLSIRSGGGDHMRQIYFDGNVIIRQAAPFIARGGSVITSFQLLILLISFQIRGTIS
jgi:hypothetical protein